MTILAFDLMNKSKMLYENVEENAAISVLITWTRRGTVYPFVI